MSDNFPAKTTKMSEFVNLSNAQPSRYLFGGEAAAQYLVHFMSSDRIKYLLYIHIQSFLNKSTRGEAGILIVVANRKHNNFI